MKRNTYLQMTQYVSARPSLARALTLGNKAITNLIYVAYPCLLIWLFIQGNPAACLGTGKPLTPEAWLAIKSLMVPLVAFVLLSVLRAWLNAPRPYEVFESKPVLPKSTKGKSFPSRHVFSIFTIAVTFLVACPLSAVGIVIVILGVLLAILRVVCGVHFPKDVIAGALLGVFAGSFVYFL